MRISDWSSDVCSSDLEVVHGLAAQELAERRAQHRAAVGVAGIRRGAGALDLQLVAAAVGGDRLAERDRAAVAELAGPVAELMAAVVGRARGHARHQGVAGEDGGELRRGQGLRVEAQGDRKSGEEGQSESVRVESGGRGAMKKK